MAIYTTLGQNMSSITKMPILIINVILLSHGTVDTSTVGTYTLTYSVTDAANNTNSTTRTVIVNPITYTLWQGDSLTFTKTAESDPNTEDNQDRMYSISSGT